MYTLVAVLTALAVVVERVYAKVMTREEISLDFFNVSEKLSKPALSHQRVGRTC